MMNESTSTHKIYEQGLITYNIFCGCKVGQGLLSRRGTISVF